MTTNRDLCKHLLNKQVGVARITQPIIDDNRSFECAAWWRKTVSLPGVYPAMLVSNRIYPEQLHVVVKIDGFVDQDCFQSLFGGVPCGERYDTRKNRGEAFTFTRSASLIDAAFNTAKTFSGYLINFFLDEDAIQAALKVAEKEVFYYRDLLEQHFRDCSFEKYTPAEQYAANGVIWTDDDRYRFSMGGALGSASYAAEKLSEVARKLADFRCRIAEPNVHYQPERDHKKALDEFFKFYRVSNAEEWQAKYLADIDKKEIAATKEHEDKSAFNQWRKTHVMA